MCAMCASPLALQAHQVGVSKKITSYPSLKNDLKGSFDYREETVVVDDNLIIQVPEDS